VSRSASGCGSAFDAAGRRNLARTILGTFCISAFRS
jgi:hypothetical protein